MARSRSSWRTRMRIATASRRRSLRTLTGIKRSSARPDTSMSPSVKGVSPRRPSCSRRRRSDRNRDCLPSQIIEDAHRNKEVLREARHIHVAQCEGSLAEAAELFAEAAFVEAVARSRRERGRALHCHFVGASAANERERLAGGTDHPGVHASALGLYSGGNGGKAVTRAGE